MTDPTCVACGYIVTGLPGTTCPECGADLTRPDAILQPRAVPPLPRGWLIVLWSAVFWLGYGVVDWAWLSAIQRVYIIDVNRRFEDPMSRAYHRVSMGFKGEEYRRQPLHGEADLTLELTLDQKATPKLTVEVTTNTCLIQMDGTSPAHETAFGSDAVMAWMTRCGVDVKRPGVRREAETIVEAVRSAAIDGGFPSDGFSNGGGGYSTDARPTRPVQAARWAFVLAWLAGAAWLWRRRDRAWRGLFVRAAPQPHQGIP
ncbi:MAG TPA: hypothetical protein VH475_05410 [Tepidisphaeraceae bacterium]